MTMLSRFRNLWRGDSLDAEFDEELRFHLDMRIEANLRAGLSQREAEREARRHLGAPMRAKEGMREARVLMSVDTLVRDLIYGARLFRRQRVTMLLALITLSLGIGATVVIFTVLHVALVRPLPFPQANRLVAIVDHYRADGRMNLPPTVPELLDLSASARSFQSVSFVDMRDAQIDGGTEPARALTARVEATFLSTLGMVPQLGRLFVAGENLPGKNRVVVLSHAFWQRNHASDRGVVGRSITVNGQPATVVGVLEPGVGFDYFSADPIELYVPFPMTPDYSSRTGEFANVRRVTAIARLKPGIDVDDASAEVETIGGRIAREYPALYQRGSDGAELGFGMDAIPLRDVVASRASEIVWLLFAVVGIVLAIACANMAQFLLARSLERRHEVGIRMALGASRGRLIRQFLTEAALIAGIASGLGLLQSIWLMDAFRAAMSARSILFADLRIDPTVVFFAVAIGAIVTLLAGLLPALHFSRGASVAGGAGWAIGELRTRSRQVLIAAEVALSIVLLVCAGLLMENLRQLRTAPRGFVTDDVTAVRLRIAGPPTPNGTGLRYREYLERIAAVPGVAAAAMADAPLSGFPGIGFSVVGREADAATLSRQRTSWRIVSPDYFNVLRVPLLAGRPFRDDDDLARAPVAIVNQEIARRFWPGGSPLGQQIAAGEGPRASVMTIVGVVGDVRPALAESVDPQIYVSYLQQSEPNATLLVRSAAERTVTPDAIKQAVWSVVREQPLFDVQPLAAVIERAYAQPRVIARVLAAFAVLAVLMSLMSVYTVVSYFTTRRTREIALRRAVGATPIDVLRLLSGQTVVWAAAGIVAGLAGAAAATRVVRSAVLGTAHLDLPTVTVIAAVYLATVALAVFLPALRGLRVDPAGVLRTD